MLTVTSASRMRGTMARVAALTGFGTRPTTGRKRLMVSPVRIGELQWRPSGRRAVSTVTIPP